MRAGGSNAKGGDWENEICRRLSRWITRGERSDLFRRNIMSGGLHTTSLRFGRDPGQPGDIAANHPDAFSFLDLWMIECKHRKAIDLHVALWQQKGELHNYIEKAEKQSVEANRSFMLIAKQNFRPAICIIPHETGVERAEKSGLIYHEFWNRRSIAFLFDSLTKTSPEPWLKNINSYNRDDGLRIVLRRP